MKKWNASKMKSAIARAKRSALGRTLCRLAGDRAGGVMMEYVVLGVLVVSAVVVTVIFFGHTIREQFTSMAHATAGQTDNAEKASERAKTDAASAESAGKTSANKFSNDSTAGK